MINCYQVLGQKSKTKLQGQNKTNHPTKWQEAYEAVCGGGGAEGAWRVTPEYYKGG